MGIYIAMVHGKKTSRNFYVIILPKIDSPTSHDWRIDLIMHWSVFIHLYDAMNDRLNEKLPENFIQTNALALKNDPPTSRSSSSLMICTAWCWTPGDWCIRWVRAIDIRDEHFFEQTFSKISRSKKMIREGEGEGAPTVISVSYTHLTLPTILRV